MTLASQPRPRAHALSLPNLLTYGRIAAIPAVVAYNKFSTDLGRYTIRLEGFVGEFSAILSRQLDERQD